MQESTKPANFTIDENATCVDTVLRYRAENPHHAAVPSPCERRVGQRHGCTVRRRVDAVAKGLIASGVAAGDRVALLSSTR